MSFYVIEPIPITDTILTGSNVPEADYNAWLDKNLVALNQGGYVWEGMCVTPAGNVYAVSGSNSAIYMQTGETGNFTNLNQTARFWQGICAAPNGNVYSCVLNGDIYMQTSGSGSFAALSQTSRDWFCMCASPNGNIYAAVQGGDIYKQTSGSGSFAALSQTSRDWRALCAAPNGNIYAVEYNGNIYMQTAGTGDFVSLSQNVRNWRGIAAAPNGDIYASTYNGDIYKQTAGTGNFIATGQTTRNWNNMCISPLTSAIYCGVTADDIYKCSGFYSISDYVIITTPNVHKIYQSLTNNNFNNNPVTDTTNWLETGSTNRWNCFNNVLGSQTEQATKIEYVLTPGAVIDCVDLLNLDSDTVDIVEIDGADQLIVNNDWTDATGGTPPTGWTEVGTVPDFTISGAALRITCDANGEGISQTIAVSAATEYQLVFLYKNTASDIAQFSVYDVTHSADILATTDLTSSTANASYSYVFTTPAGCVSIKISFLAKTAGDIVWFEAPYLCPTEYSETVTTGTAKTSVVKSDIPQKAAGILTVTINKSGTAAIGELIIGNSFTLGTMRPKPQIGFRNLSTLDEDTWGNISIVSRGYKNKMVCGIMVPSASLDSVYKFLCDHKDDMMVYIGSETYSCMQLYGFSKEPQIIPETDKVNSDMSLEIWSVI